MRFCSLRAAAGRLLSDHSLALGFGIARTSGNAKSRPTLVGIQGASVGDCLTFWLAHTVANRGLLHHSNRSLLGLSPPVCCLEA